MEIRNYYLDVIAFNSKCSGEERVLSNMWNWCFIKYDGKIFESSEKLFSWLSCESEGVKAEILNSTSPFEAKKLLSDYNKEWGNKWFQYQYEQQCIKNMWLALRLKAKYCKRFREYLLKSGDSQLVEYCYWLDKTKKDDDLWGTRRDYDNDMYIGVNATGRIMMGVREEL